jgi:CO/xanthine dehydrogenase FAD-binding subunit
MTEYFFPCSIGEAIQQLQDFGGEAQIVAGGTDVMVDLRKCKISAKRLVDITRIPGLDQIEVSDNLVTVGAAVTFAVLKESAYLNRHVHALPDAARSVGAIGIQAAATWVGNIVQAMPAADGAIVALALDAEAHIVDVSGSRWRPVETLFEGPGVSTIDPSRQLITHIRFPLPRAPWGTAWRRLGRRPSLVLPILNCAVRLCLADNAFAESVTNDMMIANATIALGPVAPLPFRAYEAEAFLQGQVPTRDVFSQAARIAQEKANPRSSTMRASREYRSAIIPTLLCDGLADALLRARDSKSRNEAAEAV